MNRLRRYLFPSLGVDRVSSRRYRGSFESFSNSNLCCCFINRSSTEKPDAVGSKQRFRRQQGVALITAVLVVALASIAAAAVLSSANIAMHRAANLRDAETEWWYADGVESWVKSILLRDLQDNKTDSLKDAWAKPVDYLPVDYGSIRGAVIDEQGLFNLNNFGVKDPQLYQKYLDQFERLLQNIKDADVSLARPLAAALRDWMDADDQPTGMDGGEDTEYLTRSPPYRSANRYLESVSEALAVKGMTRTLYQQILPYVTVLPQLGTEININTAPEPVLRSLVKQPNAELEKFLRERKENPAEDKTKMQAAFDAGTPPIGVSSQYFMLHAEVFIGSGRLSLYSFYYRPPQGAPVVLGRSTESP